MNFFAGWSKKFRELDGPRRRPDSQDRDGEDSPIARSRWHSLRRFVSGRDDRSFEGAATSGAAGENKENNAGMSERGAQRLSQRMRELYDIKTADVDFFEECKQRRCKKLPQQDGATESNNRRLQFRESNNNNNKKNTENAPTKPDLFLLEYSRSPRLHKVNARSGISRGVRSHEEQTANARANPLIRQRRTCSDDYDSLAHRKRSEDEDDSWNEKDSILPSGAAKTATKKLPPSPPELLAQLVEPPTTLDVTLNPDVDPEPSDLPFIVESPPGERKKRNSTRYKVYLT